MISSGRFPHGEVYNPARMHPDLFKIGDFSIAWYGVLITLGVLIGAWLANRIAARRGLNTNLLSDMIFFSVLWGVVGARVVYVLTSPDQFRWLSGESFWQWALKLINIREGGIAIHGGLLFGVGALLYYQRRYKINFYQYADLFVPGVTLGIIGGRLGNFFNGADTIGRFTNLGIGWTWPNFGDTILGIFNAQRNWSGMPGICKQANGEAIVSLLCINGEAARGPVHLTQIYGVFIGVILTVAAFYWLRSRRPGWVFWQFILWYSLLRSVLEETFRLNSVNVKVFVDNNLGIGLFTYTQIASIPLIALAVWQLWRIRQQPERPWGEGVAVPVPTPNSNLVSSAKAK
jgi:phosphatidylglycerol---prolipoprotein diacylglyceryl transferase